MSNATWLSAVEELARETGRIALARYRTGVDVMAKSDGSPVTEADRAAERFAREWLAQRFPDDGILGEELGEIAGTTGRRWIIDPIDGTRSFIAGVPLWGTLVAVCEGDRVIAGAAAYPAAGEWIAAAMGEGCWANGERASVSRVDRVARATVLTTDERFTYSTPERRSAWRRLADAAAQERTWGDCFGYLLVATGRAEVMVDGAMNPWDAAPLLPIITEAGGTFVDFTGARTAFGTGSIATNALVADEALGLLGVRT